MTNNSSLCYVLTYAATRASLLPVRITEQSDVSLATAHQLQTVRAATENFFVRDALGLQPTGDHYVGKLSATGQPAQPFILPGSINE